jgi:hypothetical protein
MIDSEEAQEEHPCEVREANPGPCDFPRIEAFLDRSFGEVEWLEAATART